MSEIITYGVGGYDPTKPNNNIVEVVEVPDEPVDPAKESAISKLRLLGLTDEEINAIVGGAL
jgi:hypothetical protein